MTIAQDQEIRLSAPAAPVVAQPDTVRDTRLDALERFRTLGLPTTRWEEWKYTSLLPLTREDFVTTNTTSSAVPAELAGVSMKELAIAELVFINGVFSESSSHIGAIQEGLTVRRFADALRESDKSLSHFAKYADYQKHPLTALNTALATDGVVIETAPGTIVEGFIHLVFIGSGVNAMANPRNLIIAGNHSQLAVAETYTGTGRYFTNVVTEVFAGESAIIDHTKIVLEAQDGLHVGTLQIHEERNAAVYSHTFALGDGLVRNEINAALLGTGSSCSLDGLFVVDGTAHVDNHTIIDHARPHCDSQELFKGILDGNGRGIFDGTIIVRPDAQKTTSRQVNKNLLLSETAIVDSKPTLEIHADDVKCNHGSTIGQLDEEAMFYLRGRGVGEEDARNMLIYAFASDIVDRMRIKAIGESVRRILYERMPQYLPDRREKNR